MFERTIGRLTAAIEVLTIPDRVRGMEIKMSELRDAYDAVAAAVDEAVGELDTLANRVNELSTEGGEETQVATDLRALAGRLSNAYTPSAEVPPPTTADPDVVDAGGGAGGTDAGGDAGTTDGGTPADGGAAPDATGGGDGANPADAGTDAGGTDNTGTTDGAGGGGDFPDTGGVNTGTT
jgi:hypothetical protein